MMLKNWRKRREEKRVAEVYQRWVEISEKVFQDFLEATKDEMPKRLREILESEYRDYVAVKQRHFEQDGGEITPNSVAALIPNNIWVWLEKLLMNDLLVAHGRVSGLTPQKEAELERKLAQLEQLHKTKNKPKPM